jgi:PKHD-type hydroxylase
MKNPVTVWDDAFSLEELEAIEDYGDRLLLQKATLQAPGRNDDSIRITRVARISPDPDIRPLFDRIAQVVHRLNQENYQFDVRGLENLQYTVYHGAEGGHYTWHVDHGPDNPTPRKISLSIQLTDPAQYEGCDLQFQTSGQISLAPRRRGAVIAFPSFVLHRVTPILSGTRKALVAWATGPDFR